MTIALITGAGASRAIGYSLTSELLPKIYRELASNRLFKGLTHPRQEKADRVALKKVLRQLLPGLKGRASEEYPLITDVLSIVDHALASGELLPLGGDAPLRRCQTLLIQALTDVLLGEFLEPWNRSARDRRERATLQGMAAWIDKRRDKLALITTNYDIGLEYELYRRRGRQEVLDRIDLGFEWRNVDSGKPKPRPRKPIMRVYKLHGSLDLLRCPLCGFVYFNAQGVIAAQAFRTTIDDANTCVCTDSVKLDVHMVSPSMVRSHPDANLANVWRASQEWLRRASEWIIVGYSLPPEDLAISALLMRAYAAAKRKPRIRVVQFGNQAKGRYQVLFPGCEYEANGVEDFLGRQTRTSRGGRAKTKRISPRTPSRKRPKRG